MMLGRFTSGAKDVVKDALEEARESGARSVEAEHLLLAIAGRRGDAAAACLAEAGLDREAVLAALEAEEVHSLAAAGVARAAFDLPPPAPGASPPRVGESVKLALGRGHRAAAGRGDRAIVAGHLLLGVLAAERGTVPRALALSGIDRDELAAAVGEAIAGR
jgi:ATP-dependent Clp protease ATP-binding subunit ClpA